MTDLRFTIGTQVMCNLGDRGWTLGKIIDIDYRESGWPEGKTAPYQVCLEEDLSLIYVPVDDHRYCREATPEEIRIAKGFDALAGSEQPDASCTNELRNSDEPIGQTISDYRSGQCGCCNRTPQHWSFVELYSHHYRCASRNGLKITTQVLDLGEVQVGDSIDVSSSESACKEGYLQGPTLVRLPPGLLFFDEGSLSGTITFDPHRKQTYDVRFIAVSTTQWEDASQGIHRLEITFQVTGNQPPESFDRTAFLKEQQAARDNANRHLYALYDAWEQWEIGDLTNWDTCDRMKTQLQGLRSVLEKSPRLDNGKWWAQLGGFHMNVHKLLENTLFECELYLGYALTFDNPEVRQYAEANLEGCYNKRLLEAARFQWMEGARQMMRGEWEAAAETFHQAAVKKEGWGWAVNFGDMWMGEAIARHVHGVKLLHQTPPETSRGNALITEAHRLLELCLERAEDSGAFGPEGHPWAAEVQEAFASYQALNGNDPSEWFSHLNARTTFWCAQLLAGKPPFPPPVRPRWDDAEHLINALPI